MEPIKLNVKTANEVYAALQNLDVYTRVIKDENGNEKTVSLAYELSGKARWNLTKALSKLRVVNEDFIKVRDAILKEVSGGSGSIQPTETEKMKILTEKVEEALEQPVDTTGLLWVKVKDLNLDKNQIPVAVLNLLSPILDDSE